MGFFCVYIYITVNGSLFVANLMLPVWYYTVNRFLFRVNFFFFFFTFISGIKRNLYRSVDCIFQDVVFSNVGGVDVL